MTFFSEPPYLPGIRPWDAGQWVPLETAAPPFWKGDPLPPVDPGWIRLLSFGKEPFVFHVTTRRSFGPALGFVLLWMALVLSAGSSYAADRLRISTTTSTDNSGLLNVLLPPFEKMHNCKVDVIAVGTGKALKLGEAGDVDAVLVHSRKAEDKFVAEGYGINRRDVMYNDFVIIGPSADPAGM